MSSEQFKNLKSYLSSINVPRAELARRLGVAPTTLASWINGRHPAPSDLAQRIERCLALKAGEIASWGTP